MTSGDNCLIEKKTKKNSVPFTLFILLTLMPLARASILLLHPPNIEIYGSKITRIYLPHLFFNAHPFTYCFHLYHWHGLHGIA